MDRSVDPTHADLEQDRSALDFQARVIMEHTQNTGEYFGRFCSGFASYARKLAHVRDQGDELARCFSQYSETQPFASRTKKNLTEFSHYIAAVQDHMQARVLRIEAKVVAGFSKYGAMSHVIKDEIEKGAAIREREQRSREELQKIQSRQPKSPNESNLLTAQVHQQRENVRMIMSDVKKAHELLLKEADRFEQQKLDDLRRILMNFCEIELAYAAKALRLFSQAYNVVKQLDAKEDIEAFRNQMHILHGSSSVTPDPNLLLRYDTVDVSSVDDFEDTRGVDGTKLYATHGDTGVADRQPLKRRGRY